MRISLMCSRSAFVAIVLFCGSFVPAVYAQPGGGAGPAPTPIAKPDEGTIENSPASESSLLNSWVSRSNNEAIAISVYKDSTQQLVGKLRRYSKGSEDYREMNTQIQLPDSSTLPAQQVVPFKLDRLTSNKHPDVFSMMFTPPTGNPIRIGYLSFIRGNKSRDASSVVIRLDHNVVVGTINPCDEPPIDDIGEEEEIYRSPDSNFGVNAPGASVRLIPTISQPN